MKRILSKSVDKTLSIAREFAKNVKPGDVICLEGDLGAGKTHFVKGFVEAFKLNRNVVTSPTFTIINEYEGTLPVYHFDFYRIEDIEEALEIGVEEYLYGTGVCLIEWPDRIAEILPDYSRRIEMNTLNPDEREIIFHE